MSKIQYEKTWYYKKVQKLWFEIKNIFGSECMICKSTKNLQLHHKYYVSDSIRPKSHNENGNVTIKRKQEAIDHPERFLLICLSCHNRIEPRLPHLKGQQWKRGG